VAPTQPEGDTSSIGASVPWAESSMPGLRVALVDMRGEGVGITRGTTKSKRKPTKEPHGGGRANRPGWWSPRQPLFRGGLTACASGRTASLCSPGDLTAWAHDQEKFYTLPDHVLRCNESRTTSLCSQGDRKASSPSNPRTAAGGFYGIRDLHDPCNLLGLSCLLSDRPASSS
jgi:hypothetical protein